MVLYEVNLSVQNDILPEYTQWLGNHIEEILKIQGFTGAHFWKNESQEEFECTLLTCHYTLKTRNDLQNYLDRHAKALREDGLKRFPGKFKATRRILLLEKAY